MMRGRRVLAVVMVLCMIMGLCVCPIGKEKAQAAVFGDYEYEVLNSGTICITKYTGSDTTLIIPGEIDNKEVTAIGDYAFSNCKGLRKVSIPTGVKRIGNWAFYSCTELTEINIPDSVTAIGDHAFGICMNLLAIQIPAGVTRIEGWTFDQCASLTEIYIPDGVTYIGEAAFQDCIGLIKLKIPDTVTIIGDWALNNCKSLMEINIPIGVSAIGEETFNACNNLQIVYYSGTKEQWNKIEIHVNGNEALKNAVKNFTGISDLVEYKVLEDGTIEITGYNGNDTVLTLPDEIEGRNVTSIGINAFADCEGLAKVTLPLGIICIGVRAFADSAELTEINIPDGVTNIGDEAFMNCTGLSEISFPIKMASIGSGAFRNCSSLTEVFYAGTQEQWNQIAIDSDGNEALKNAKIYFKSDAEGGWVEDYTYKVLNDETLEITGYKGTDQVLRFPEQIDGKVVSSIGNEAFNSRTDLIEVYIPSNIDRIGSYAFRYCTGLTKVELSVGLTRIESFAFQGCSNLRYITIPNSVTITGDSSFADCTSLEKISIPNSIKIISIWLFSGCTSLKEINIPNGVTGIGEHAFEDCSGLSQISIPESLTSISAEAFNRCSSLMDVHYNGTKEQWEKVRIAVINNESLLNAFIHFIDDPSVIIPDVILPATGTAKQELEYLKSGDSLSIMHDFQQYLSDEQIDIIANCLYTWLAEINYAYKYSEKSGIKERIMKKAGIDPQGDFVSGEEQAITHISVETKYGTKTFEITLNLGTPDSSGNLYPAYNIMHYEVLEKESIPSDVPTSGQIGRDSYTVIGAFIECVSKAASDSLHSTYQWESLSDEMVSGILIDKTVTEIIGNKNGSFSDGSFIVYAKPLITYSKKVTISCPVDVYVYSMDGKEVGSIEDNKPNGGDQNVRFDVNGDTKSVYLTGNDYYLNLCGTDTGTMKYEVEEIANDNVRRNVQFLELQLEKDMQYEGYVFRPLNIDQDLYALRTVSGSDQEVFYADEDKHYETLSLFKRIQGLTLSQQNTSLDANKTVQLNVSLFPLDASNPNLLWTTDNTSVAKVDNNGLVTAVGTGRATVTVSTKDGSFLKQYCVIDVSEKNNGTGGNSGSSSSGWYGGGMVPSVEEEKNPVVVKLHYVLQFNANGGTNLSRRAMTLLADDSPGIMPKVNRKDYVFDGWYTQQDGGTQVTGDKPLTEAATLYAHWTKVEVPAKAAAPTLLSKKKGQMQVSFENIDGAAGYQIEYSENNQFTSAKVKEVGSTVKTKTISGLKAGQKYYVRMRAYSMDSMKNKIYGAYSAVKSVKVEG